MNPEKKKKMEKGEEQYTVKEDTIYTSRINIIDEIIKRDD